MNPLEGWDPDDVTRYHRHLYDRAHRLRLDPRVRVVFSESDLAQETLLKAADAAEGPRGTSDRQRLAWLERIQNNLLMDKYEEHFAQKRDVRRDRHLASFRQALEDST